MNYYALLLDVAALIFIAARCMQTLNKMSEKTRHLIRVSYILTCAGSFMCVMGYIFGHMEPEWQRTIMTVGLAGLIMANKRTSAESSSNISDGRMTIYDGKKSTVTSLMQ